MAAFDIKKLLQSVVAHGASDLHLVSRTEPQIRLDGALKPVNLPKLTGDDIEEMCYSLITEKQKQHFEENNELDFALELDEPKMFRVLLHNDDYTSMDFVVDVLIRIFHKTHAQAEQIMLQIHEKNKAVCGVYTFEIAQTKAEQVKQLAKQSEFPLLATIEEDA